MMEEKLILRDIPKEKFEFVQRDDRIHDERLQTKAVGYVGDAWNRFRRNKSAVVAFCLILVLLLFALIVPFVSHYTINDRDGYYKTVLPRNDLLRNAGFWDGGRNDKQNTAGYLYLNAIGQENGKSAIMKEYDTFVDSTGETFYNIRVDSYNSVGFVYVNLSEAEYKALMQYQDETGIQVYYPLAATQNKHFVRGNDGANFWYKLKDESQGNSGMPLLDENGQYIANYLTSGDPQKAGYTSLRIAGDGENGVWYTYAQKNQTGYRCRVDYDEYYYYKNGYHASFLFGTNQYGQDIFTCLAVGARFSLLLSITVASINFILGVIYGSAAGYYGGAVDMIMERIAEILGSVPFIIVATLFQLHLAAKVGPVPSLLFAFILKGWVGTAGSVRTQFYRFKGQEYVLAARTLGASDTRLIFKHIFPNSLGTIVTGAVMTIPGVIFSESMLSYLHIINLDTSATVTSIGTMLSNGNGYLNTYPHIIMFPAIFIAILEICFNLFGNGLRDALNPSLRGADN